MTIYFDNLDTLQQFTMNLDYHSDSLACHNCPKSDQFVSHGFVYKKQHNDDKRPVGKRLFCSNRSGKTGCGSTLRLYLTEQIPNLAYTTVHLTLFLTALIAGATIAQAYQKAIACDHDPRNAYRWLNKLQGKLIDYRQILKVSTPVPANPLLSRTRRFHIMLPTLDRLFEKNGIGHSDLCAQYQYRYQQAFV